jgi:hypothetical protein
MEAAGPAVLGAEVERLDARLCLRGAVGDNVDDVAPDESEWEEERSGCSAAAASASASAAKASASAALNASGGAFSLSMSMLILSIALLGPLLWRKFDSERRRRTRRRDLVCSLVIEKAPKPWGDRFVQKKMGETNSTNK